LPVTRSTAHMMVWPAGQYQAWCARMCRTPHAHTTSTCSIQISWPSLSGTNSL
jgi:hypothetical protein